MADDKPKKAAPKKEAKPEAAKAADEEATKLEKKAPADAGAESGKKETAAGAPAGAAPAAPVAAPTAAELLAEDANAKKIIRAKGAKNIAVGIANILATLNNTNVTITDMQGNVLGWSSAGRVGFKG